MSTAMFLEIGQTTGSGFMIIDSLNNVYLITARHILHAITPRGQFTTNFIDSVLNISYYSRDTEIDPLNTLMVNLYGLTQNNLIKWPQDGSDILVARIGSTVDSTSLIYYNQFVSKADTTARPINPIDYPYLWRFGDDLVNVGNEIYIVGFPTSLNLPPHYIFDRPLLRRGILAARYRSTNTLIIDCPSFPGNSGGPVFQTLEGPIYNNRRLDGFLVIGIVVAVLPYHDLWQNVRYRGYVNIDLANSGYSIVEPIQKALDLIRSMP